MNIKHKINFSLALALSLAFAQTPASAKEENKTKPAAIKPVEAGYAGSYLSGQFAKESGDIGGAIYYLKRVYREKPGNMEIARQLQGMLLLDGKVGEAAVLAADIHKADKKDALSNLLLALEAIKRKEWQKALDALSHASDYGTVQLWEPLMTAWVQVERDQLAKPLKADDLNIDIGRIMPLVHYHLALINSEAGFKQEAAEHFRKAIEDPKDPPDRIMGQILVFYANNNQPAVLEPLVQGYLEANPGKRDGIPLIVSTRDGVAEILYTMGGIMLSARMSNDAAIYQQLALYIKPDFPEAALTLADAYSDLQQYAKANEYYAGISAASPYYKKARLHIAINLEREGKLAESLSMLDKLDGQYPGDMEAMVTKGDLLRIHSRFPEAVNAYTHALERVTEMKSMYWPVFFARGSCHERLGRWEEAEADLKMALELKPDQPDVLNYLGYGWLEREKNLEQAHVMIQKAYKARPDDAEIVDSMGWALYMQGDYANAVPYLEKAVELLPSDPTVNDHLGDVYWRVGRKTEARYQWQRSLSFSPDEKLFNRIHQKLRDGLPDMPRTTSVSSNDLQKPAINNIP